MNMKKERAAQLRPVYNERYKFYEALVQNVSFRKEITKYKQWLSEKNHPVPINGFKNENQFTQWLQGIFNDYFSYQQGWNELLKRYIKDRPIDVADRAFLKDYIFFEKITYEPFPLTLRFHQDKNGELEILIRIYPHTRSKDIVREWGWIKEFQQQLPGYKKRNRKSFDFELLSEKASEAAIRTAKSRLKKRLKDVTDNSSVN